VETGLYVNVGRKRVRVLVFDWLAPTRNGLTSEEPLAEAVGTVMGKLVAALYKHGIYEL